MPFPSGTYITQIADPAVRAELEQLISLLQGYLSQEHKNTGAHGNVTADSLTVATNSETGATGQISANGATHTLGEFVFRSGSSVVNETVTIGGDTAGWKLGRRNLTSPFSVVAQGFTLFDLSKDTSLPVFDIGYYATGDYFLLIPRAAGGKDFAIGYKDNVSADRIKYVAVQDGVYEKGRSAAAGYWTDYTPTWSTGGTLNNGTLAGRYTQIGNTCHYKIALTVGSTTTFSGAGFLFTLPVNKRNDAFLSVDPGAWYAIDSSASTSYGGLLQTNTTQVQPVTFSLVVNNQVNSTLTTTVPFTWATGDILEIYGSYEIA